MIKNRIRTAAIAGAAALATAVSGVTVPAMAQPNTLNSQDNFNNDDASAHIPVTPVNHTEQQVKALTDATAAYLANWKSETTLDDLVAHILGDLDFDPSEEAAHNEVKAQREAISAELAKQNNIIKQIRESVAYALLKDREATAARDAYIAAAVRLSNELAVADNTRTLANGPVEAVGQTTTPKLYNLLDVVKATSVKSELGGTDTYDVEGTGFANVADTTVGRFDTTRGEVQVRVLPGLTYLPANPTLAQVETFVAELTALEENVEDRWTVAGQYGTDSGPGKFISREYRAYLGELRAAIANVNDVLNPLETAYENANREAQLTDVRVRQGYLERAVAQRNALRTLEAYVGTYERYISLYEADDALYNDGDEYINLRAEYREFLTVLQAAVNANNGKLTEADEALLGAFIAWQTDQQTNNDGNFETTKRVEFAESIYKDIIEQGRAWQDELQRLQLIDRHAPRVTGSAQDDEDIVDGETPGETPAPGDNSTSSIGGSSFLGGSSR